MESEQSTGALGSVWDRLIAEARGGSTAALDRLIELLSEHLWAELGQKRQRRGLGPSRGLSDLIQDTVLRARMNFDRFERSTFGDFKQWARTILYRRWQEWARNHQQRNDEWRKEAILLAILARAESQSPGADEALQTRQEAERAYGLFKSRLRPNEQFIIDFRLFKGMRFKEIAKLGHMSEDAAGKAYARAMTRLRQLFYCNDQP